MNKVIVGYPGLGQAELRPPRHPRGEFGLARTQGKSSEQQFKTQDWEQLLSLLHVA
jgi:hypothetical protein